MKIIAGLLGIMLVVFGTNMLATLASGKTLVLWAQEAAAGIVTVTGVILIAAVLARKR